MKKDTKELQSKTVEQLEKEINTLRQELSHSKIDMYINSPKDTNQLMKKRKKIAHLLTILTAKRESV